MNMLQILGRDAPLFGADVALHDDMMRKTLLDSRCLVIGAAGSIGQAVTRELFKRGPAALHVVDVSENNMVELVRDIRSTIGYRTSDFQTFAIDCGSPEYEALINANKGYDFVFNLSALKHVRSEKEPFTLMRMVVVNVLNTLSTLRLARAGGTKKYFCVSTDKATNPVNMMGASKRIMEMFLIRESLTQPISTARFANVGFSDGSLLHGFSQRFAKRQPISAPNDVRRYFLTSQESGELCLMSGLLGENRDIFFPKLSENLKLTRFSDIAVRYLEGLGYTPYECQSEDEARSRASELIARKKWPVFFFTSDTTGEKDFEEFYTNAETLDMVRFSDLGVIKKNAKFDAAKLDRFLVEIERLRKRRSWEKRDLVTLFQDMIPDFLHKETGKYLDARM